MDKVLRFELSDSKVRLQAAATSTECDQAWQKFAAIVTRLTRAPSPISCAAEPLHAAVVKLVADLRASIAGRNSKRPTGKAQNVQALIDFARTDKLVCTQSNHAYVLLAVYFDLYASLVLRFEVLSDLVDRVLDKPEGVSAEYWACCAHGTLGRMLGFFCTGILGPLFLVRAGHLLNCLS